MPVSVRRTPFGKPADPPLPKLRTPQARILAPLQPDDPSDPLIDWPVFTRAILAVRAGYTTISGTVTRALNGIHQGSSSGDPHLGLLALGLVEEVVLDVNGVSEVSYRATAAGVRSYHAYLADQGGLPQLRDAATCTNDRYKKNTDKDSEKVT